MFPDRIVIADTLLPGATISTKGIPPPPPDSLLRLTEEAEIADGENISPLTSVRNKNIIDHF